MRITAFNPLIVTKDAENVIKLFEALGFEKRHSLGANTGETEFTSVRMKNAEGFYVDVANVPVEKDMTLIRINVDNFEEAYKFLTERGFKNPKGDHTVDTKTNRSACLISPSGFAFDLCQHIKD
ncbi:hypothetical protein [uncultured Ruminococcus sp.]|uniref:hypothetical protein n=1 Tax=uncultured Ruminococcus sp. TaxID=165186 RepID=UPI00262A141D|nr:hypothetical protein [uncultured Ruminococcus sp.]